VDAFKMTSLQLLDMARAMKREQTLDKFKLFAVAKSMNAENLGTYQECEFCRASRSKGKEDYVDHKWQPWSTEMKHKPDCLYAEIVNLIGGGGS